MIEPDTDVSETERIENLERQMKLMVMSMFAHACISLLVVWYLLGL